MTPWTDDVQGCVDSLPNNTFKTSDLYQFENYLWTYHRENNNIKAKIRQQLQVLRDKRKTIKSGKKPGTWVKVKVKS